MASLYISEYAEMAQIQSSKERIAAPQEPCLADQKVSIGGSSTQSEVFNVRTRFVRVHTDAICSVAFGADPTASASTKRLPAGATEYFGVIGGTKVAVITNS